MESQITREAAWELLRKYNKDSIHLQHALTVEGVMRWYAGQLGFAAGCSREERKRLCYSQQPHKLKVTLFASTKVL